MTFVDKESREEAKGWELEKMWAEVLANDKRAAVSFVPSHYDPLRIGAPITLLYRQLQKIRKGEPFILHSDDLECLSRNYTTLYSITVLSLAALPTG